VTLPNSAGAIYDLILADAVVAAKLGVYVLANQSEIPAISTMFTAERLMEGTQPQGVEVMITALPGGSPEPTLSDEILTNYVWRIYVSLWQPYGSRDDLQAVAERIVALLPGRPTWNPITGDPPGSDLGLLDQVVISWTNPTGVISAAGA
jgi:hypothetical protein